MSGRLTKHLRLNTSGDTIVEVLLAIAIVSAVLGAAYVSTSQSLGNARQAEERSEAAKLVEGQLERLKVAFQTDPIPFNTVGSFCLDDTPARVATSNPACTVGRYALAIERSGNDFTATAKWDRAGGGASQEQVRIVYRLYAP